eukprot:GHRR01009264.1.p1 GENE.GHRR01009264.1~~GHRR01009264.1.p1  ORF type:complete len:122 (+),score=25.65 GHRR01009264.1:846-1211(+)
MVASHRASVMLLVTGHWCEGEQYCCLWHESVLGLGHKVFGFVVIFDLGAAAADWAALWLSQHWAQLSTAAQAVCNCRHCHVCFGSALGLCILRVFVCGGGCGYWTGRSTAEQWAYLSGVPA